MYRIFKALGVFSMAAITAGCVMHGPEGVAYSTPSGGVGVTSGAAGGSLSGGSGSPDGGEKKEQCANTPIGMDRDGHGPAPGAILDPTGALQKPH